MKNKRISLLLITSLVLFGGSWLSINESFAATEKFNSSEISIALVGDLSFARGIAQVIAAEKNVDFPLAKIKNLFANTDCVVGNLESPITPGRRIESREMTLRSDPGVELALKKAGFNILTLANNHSTNFGEQGLLNTFKYLNAADIKYVGAGKNFQAAYQPVFFQKNDLKIAFLAFADKAFVPNYFAEKSEHAIVAVTDVNKMVQAVKSAKQNADFVVVALHSGIEYQNHPNQAQINFAHAAIDAGADFVVGHHPHVIQSLEKYRGKYIFYSLGNFVFDQKFSNDVRDALMLKLRLQNKVLRRIDIYPLFINDHYQPELVTGKSAKKIIARLNYAAINEKPVITWDAKQNNYLQSSYFFIEDDSAKESQAAKKTSQNYKSAVLNLTNGQLSLKKKNAIVWKTPADIKVDAVQIADVTNSGQATINFSLWKTHSFGTDKPFWLNNDAGKPRNHFFIYRYFDGKVKPVWGSSNLDAPNCKFAIQDVNHDGKNELITLEGDYADYPQCNGKYLAIWVWNGWGFTNLWRSQKGSYSDFRIEKVGNATQINVY